MTQQIEIEFKNMLTKEQYDQLLIAFHIQPEQIQHQANHYFDTADFQLKTLKSGLRIRQKGRYFECTLKEKSSEHAHLETTDRLTEQQAIAMLNGETFTAPSVQKRLEQLQINIRTLNVFGSLETNRVEIDYKGGTLVFDHSHYLQHDDYEVEYETNDVNIGYTIFQQFLREHHIPIQPADKKIARFMHKLVTSYTPNSQQ